MATYILEISGNLCSLKNGLRIKSCIQLVISQLHQILNGLLRRELAELYCHRATCSLGCWEERGGVRVRVVYEPANGKIITAFPDDKPTPPALKPIKK